LFHLITAKSVTGYGVLALTSNVKSTFLEEWNRLLFLKNKGTGKRKYIWQCEL